MKSAIIKSSLVGLLALSVSVLGLLLLALSLGHFDGPEKESPTPPLDILLLNLTSQQNLNESRIKSVVEDGANINATTRDSGSTPLILVARGNDASLSLRLIQFMIEHGANVHAQDKDARTFLLNLLHDGTTLTPSQFHELSTYLISKNMSDLFNIPGWSSGVVPVHYTQPAVPAKATPVQAAVKQMEVRSETLTLLRENSVNLNYIDDDGYSILTYALQGKRSTSLLSHLISLEVDWNHINPYYGGTQLHYAAQYCYRDGIRFFLDKGFNINQQDFRGRTPLHMAVLFGGWEGVLRTARFLIKNGADVSIRNKDGHTPSYYCNEHHLCELLRLGKDGIY